MPWYGVVGEMNNSKMVLVLMALAVFSSICYFYAGSYVTPISINKNQSTDNWIKKMEEKYLQTGQKIRKICDEYRETNPSKFRNDFKDNERNLHLMVDLKHHLAYCSIAKVKYIFEDRYFIKKYISTNAENSSIQNTS